ncbi:T9SS type A sorting domain-containing protein [Aequorivita sediminis]|uniref:T9SS type A sorting domain-containing protein n=1 Tax=Aequorivita sediminis TaxID=3073653 RepID=UPI0028B1AA16|nr:T9SS type A sorting domain-containing protein [Aequorivita sp. F6058]
MRLFPNPATDQFTIFRDKNIITAVDIVDTTGKVVLKETNLSVKEATLNTSTL